MALKTLYQVTDCNGEVRFVEAQSFGEAEKKFLEWETPNDAGETCDLIDGIVHAGELIDGGTREEDLT